MLNLLIFLIIALKIVSLNRRIEEAFGYNILPFKIQSLTPT